MNEDAIKAWMQGQWAWGALVDVQDAAVAAEIAYRTLHPLAGPVPSEYQQAAQAALTEHYAALDAEDEKYAVD